MHGFKILELKELLSIQMHSTSASVRLLLEVRIIHSQDLILSDFHSALVDDLLFFVAEMVMEKDAGFPNKSDKKAQR